MKSPKSNSALAFVTALAATGAIASCSNGASPDEPVSEQGVRTNMEPELASLIQLENAAIDERLKCARELFHKEAVNEGPYEWMNLNCPGDQIKTHWVKQNCPNQGQMVAQREKGNPLKAASLLRNCILEVAGLEKNAETWQQRGSSPDSTVMQIRTSQVSAQNAKISGRSKSTRNK